jgi:hypothetical protein
LICTRQGSNLQPYDPKSYPYQGLPEKVTLESRASKPTVGTDDLLITNEPFSMFNDARL